MASDPYFDPKRGIWRMKYRPDPSGPWVTVQLCRHPTGYTAARPPKKPPQEAIDRARDFAEIEYRARHGLGAAPARAKGLADYLSSYADSQALSARAGSNRQLRRHIKSFLEFAGRRNLSSIQGVTRAHCREYMESRIRKVARSTLKTERGFLIGAWTRAVEDGLMASNPWTSVEVPGKDVETSITFWTSEEIAGIAGACSKPWQSDFVLVLANTGLRISTALALEWNWIDWAAGTIRVPAGVEEVKTAYTLSMGRVARDVLTRRLAMSDGRSKLAFPSPYNGKVIGYDTARAAIGRAIVKAKVRPGTAHDLRHSYGRALALASVPITVIQSQMGHSNLKMTQRYTATGAVDAARFLEDFGVGEA